MIRRAKRIAYSLDDVVGRATEDFDDLDGRLNRSLTADDNTEEEAFEAILTDQIYALMKSRSIREQSILKMRIDDEFTLSAIGGIEGLSAPRIKQILDEIASGMRTEIDPDA
jgi:DNA-directed RNA polymerase specialized sigma subunit